MRSAAASFVDGTFGAGGYTRAILEADPQQPVVAIDRDPDAIAGGRGAGRRGQGPPDAGRRPLRRLDDIAARRRASRPSTASCSISASPRCSSTRPSAASRSATTARSTCAWSATAPSAADLVNEASRGRARRHLLSLRRGAARARRSPAPSSSARRRQPFDDHAAARRSRRASLVRAGAGRHASGDAHLPGAAHRRQRRARRARARRCTRPSACCGPADGSSVVTFHSLEDRIVKQFFAARTGRAARRLAPPAGARTRPSRASACVTRGPVAAERRRRSARNPRARSAKLRAGERTDAPAQERFERHRHAGRTAADGRRRGGRR